MNRGRAGDYDDGYGRPEHDAYDEYGYGSPDEDATVNINDYDGEFQDGPYEDDGSYHDEGYHDDGYDDGDYSEEYYGEDQEELPVSNRILTIPNLISLARLAGVPLFLALVLSPYYGGPKYDVWALVILALSGFSDWLDGKLARRWNQMTKFGAMIDPLADRLYILATLVALTMRQIIPLWLPIVLVGRDVAMLVLITPKLRRAGYGVALPVHFLGKAATFNLLYAFPLLLLGQLGEKPNHLTDIANIFGWAFVGWGTALYLLAGGMYFVQAQQITRGSGR
nr:CDP-alcohol phosphatidyltransferase family protein [Catenulispora pinisilvae]